MESPGRFTHVTVAAVTLIAGALILGQPQPSGPVAASTDFVDSVLTAPDEPQGTNFQPNSIQELGLADPGAAITLIEAPEGGPTGDANLDFPLDLPAGRLGVQPALSMTYSSGRGDGWLGMGWDLTVPSVDVDTAFGVPRYDPDLETETYLLNGAYLAPTADLLEPRRRQPDRVFTRRVEGSFERIVRKGSAPDGYWWEVTDQNGTRFIYGLSPEARLRDYQSPRNVFRWMLERIVDVHGNTADFTYFTDSGTDGEPWVQIYPQRIDYTGADGQGAFYRVEFVRDGGGRPDRLSSGLAGFKTLTRFRLDRVDVTAGGQLVRRYRFLYRAGDFSKSLLETLAVTGDDGSTELYRHSFEYYTMPRRPNGDLDGFTPQQTWGGMASSDDATHTTSFSAGAHSFVGLAPNAACQGHAGAQVGASGGASATERTFVDVNGDGLPDRVDEDGRLELNRDGSFETTSIAGANLLARTNELHFDVGVGLHSPGEFAQVGESFVWSHANDDHAVSDVNGDGWPDLVSTQGSFAVRLNDRGQRFLDPVDWGGFSFEGIDLAVPEEEEQVLENFPLSNSLRQLELPFAGRVSVAGTIQKLAAGGTDGLEVTIFQGSTAVWKRRFAAGDTNPCDPGPGNSCGGGLALDVAAGSRLYFMADSIADTAADALSWVPSVTYQGRDGTAREPYGARVFVFDGGADFRLAGPPGGDWLAAAEGTVRVLGTIDKQTTADDVAVVITRARSQDENVPRVPVFTLDLEASETGSFGGFPEIAVEVGDVLRFEVSSESQVDPERVRWTPTVTYEGGVLCLPEQPGDEPIEKCGTLECRDSECTVDGEPVPIPAETLTQPAQVLTAVHDPLPFDQPTVFWTAPAQGSYEVAVDWQGPQGGHQKPVHLYVQGLHTLFDKRQVPVGDNEVSYTVPVDLGQGAPLYVTALADDAGDAGTLTATVDGDAAPTNRRWTNPEGHVLSGGYHRWFYGEWNGSVPFKEPTDPESEDLISGLPQWQGTRELEAPVWRAAGFDLYHAAGGSKPSRRGGNVVVELGVAAGESGSGPQIVRKTYGHTLGVNVAAPIAFTASTAENFTQIDLVDVNGDRYPDQVSEGQVRYSNGHGAFGELEDLPGFSGRFRESADGSYSLGIGLGISFKKKDGKGKSKEVVNTMPSVGRTLSFSQPRTNLVDVNGDGLPDRVSMQPNTEEVTVELNLGYRFGAAESWTLPAWKSRQLCNEFLQIPLGEIGPVDSPDSLALSRSAADNAGLAIGPFGGGVATNISRSVVELADINGDGLADHVFKDQGEDFFRVKLNLGDRWADEAPWYTPPWQTSLGGIYNALGLFECLDAVTLQGAINGNGSVGAPICIPLVPPVAVAGLQIEISVQAGGGAGGVELLFDDLNGDGLADQVLKKGGDPNVYSKLNKAERVNLLKKVVRPLQGSFVLGYERQGNRVDYSAAAHRIDMPGSQWVLSSVSLDDGQGNVYDTSWDYFDDALYDREERQAYGYARVQATLGDGSTVDTLFHNQDFYSRNLPLKVTRRDAEGFLFLVQTSDYELREVAAQSFFPALRRQETVSYEGTTKNEGDGGGATVQTFDYDDLGNVVLSETLLDDGPAGDLRVSIDYRFEPTLYWVRPEHLRAANLEGRMLRQRTGFYTDLGDLERLVQVLSGGRNPDNGEPYDGAEVATTFTYFDDGNPETVTDSSGYTLTYSYDDETRTHVTGVVDSFGYATAIDYDLKWGLPTTTTDENDNVLTRVYDGFGRLHQVFAPGDAASEPTISMTYAQGADPPYAVTDHKDVTRPGDPIATAVFVNGLGQTIQTKRDTTYDDGSTSTDGFTVSGKLLFDERARIAQEGQPIFSAAPLTDFVDVPLVNPTGYNYDVLDRVRKVSFPQGAATRIEYGFGDLDGTKRLLRRRIDALGRATKLFSNAAGSVIGVEQRNTIAGVEVALVTRYGYSALQSLRSVSDPEGNVTSIDNDTLGRQVVVDNPDAGRTEYRYSLAGNLGAEITANLAAANQQIRYAYTFHRLDLVDFPVTTDVVYAYGEPGAECNRANRVARVTDESGFEERCYSDLGQVVETKKTANVIGGQGPLGPYVSKFAYDSFDRLLEVVYPDGETLTYGFDAGGRVTSATGAKDGDATVYVARVGYDQFGDQVRMDYGNGVVEKRAYDPKSRFLARMSAAGGPAGKFQDLVFGRDAVGSITRRENQAELLQGPIVNGPVAQTFRYDDLYQLVHAEGTYESPPNKLSAYTLDLAYDELDNVTRKNQLHTIRSGGGPPVVQKKTTYDWTYLYENAQPNAASHIGDRTFHYDLDGNQKGWDSDSTGQRRTIVWDERNRVKSVADQGRTTRFLYDADGQRTNKRGSLGETVYVNPYFSIRNGAIGSKQVFVDGDRVATRIVQPQIPPPPAGDDDEDPPIVKKLYFYHGDQLTSTEYVTDDNAELFQHFEYFPFGEGWVAESSVTQRTPYLWNSKELDVQTGLYYFGFRYFQPRESQWLSADPILDNLLDPSVVARPDLSVLPYRQPGQMYAYSSNDPVNLVDPSGLDEIATVTVNGTTYRFYGEDTFGDQGGIDARTLNVGGRPIGAILLSTKTARGIQPWLAAAAGRMQGNCTVFCTEGRERSAFHVFAALYVNQGLSKTQAAQRVETAVLNAQSEKAAQQTRRMLSQADWFMGLADRYAPPPSVEAAPQPTAAPQSQFWGAIPEPEVRDIVYRNNQLGWGAERVKYDPQ